MATLSNVRILLGDLAKWDRQTATGDGATTRYIVSRLPIVTDSEIVTIDGTAKTSPTDYTIDADLGLLIFTTAPGSATAIVAQFAYAEMSDESINAIIALESNNYMAAALCAQSIAGKYATLVDKSVGDLKLSYSQRSKAWADLSKSLRMSARISTSSVLSPWAGGISQSEKTTERADTDRVQPVFTREFAQQEGDDSASF